MLEEAGFEKIEITPIEGSRRLISQLLPGHGIEDYVISSAIEAAKPLDAVSRKDDPVTKKEPPQTSEISKKTIDLFRSGYLCAEVISAAVLDSCGQMPSSLLTKCASGFCGGLGGTSKELCGAFTGGVLALSYLFGRTQPRDSLKECGELVKTFRERFLGAFGSLNCGTLLEMFQKQESPQMACVRLTAQSAGILLDLLAEFKNATGIDPLILDSLPREEVTVGQCPFS